MATWHRPRYRTTVCMSLFVVLALSACGAPATIPATPGASSAPSAQPSSQPSPAPSAALASPPTEQPGSTEPDTHEPTTGAFYLFPEVLPNGLEVRAVGALTEPDHFSLNLARTGQETVVASIVGGKRSPAGEPPTTVGQMAEITVRTSQGTAYDHGSGYSIFWQEQDIPYAVIGNLTLDEARAVAEGLQSTDLENWQMKLAEAGQ